MGAARWRHSWHCMRVLIITQIYRPEMGALANRMHPIARKLAASGHAVSVATGMPNYPEGVVFPGYRNRLFMKEKLPECTVFRTSYFTVPRNHSQWRQLFSYLSFVVAAFISALRAGPVDVVFVTSPPIFPVIAGILIARLRKAKLVFDLRDLWPDEIVACGAQTEDALSIRLIKRIERWGYKEAACVTCTTNAFIDTVVKRGVKPEKAVLIPNGADLQLFHPMPGENLAKQAGSAKPFVVLYSGLLGIKHGIEVILEAAELLKDHSDIKFVFIGNGARSASLRQLQTEKNLHNVEFLGEKPLNEVPQVIANSDICVTSLLAETYLEKIIPVKIFEYMACAKPVVASIAGEGAAILTLSGAGMVTAPGDARALADAILKLRSDPQLCADMSARGLDYVTRNYSREVAAERLEGVFRRLVSGDEPNAGYNEKPHAVVLQSGEAVTGGSELSPAVDEANEDAPLCAKK